MCPLTRMRVRTRCVTAIGACMDRLQIIRDVFPISGGLGSLQLVEPRSAEDFAEAMLASKRRLGRWLNP